MNYAVDDVAAGLGPAGKFRPDGMEASLAGKTALITGASSGIGRAIALACASQGMRLVLVGRDPTRLEDAADSARRTAAAVSWHALDLTLDSSTEALVDTVTAVDVLVLAAGAYTRGLHSDLAPDDLNRLIETNIRAPYRVTQALLPRLKDSRGQLVFINSTQGVAAGAQTGIYAATQHAMKAKADSLREELNEHGVRVLTMHIGRTATPLQERIFAMEDRPYRPELLMQAEDVAAMVLASLMLPRTAEVTSVHMRPMQKS